MKIHVSKYVLEPVIDGVKPREGALLRFMFDDGSVGYADCSPEALLGDVALDKQLEHLKSGKLTTLLQQSLMFAKMDAEARKKKKSVFDALPAPENNMTLLQVDEKSFSDALAKGFTHFKIKVLKDWKAQIALLKKLLKAMPEHCFVRFDFTSQLNEEELRNFYNEIKEWKKKIDYFEDPIPYEKESWQKMQLELGISFACDRESVNRGSDADIVVIKPAVQPFSSEKLKVNQKVVFTSTLDHPLGQVCAAYVAAKTKKEKPGQVLKCGLSTQHAYKPTKYSMAMGSGPVITLQQGTGFGFDELLAQENWLSI